MQRAGGRQAAEGGSLVFEVLECPWQPHLLVLLLLLLFLMGLVLLLAWEKPEEPCRCLATVQRPLGAGCAAAAFAAALSAVAAAPAASMVALAGGQVPVMPLRAQQRPQLHWAQ